MEATGTMNSAPAGGYRDRTGWLVVLAASVVAFAFFMVVGGMIFGGIVWNLGSQAENYQLQPGVRTASVSAQP